MQSLEAKGKLKVISTPQYNSVTFISMNNQNPPFDNVNVRRAVAFALPYDDMFKAALFGRGSPLFGATWADGKPPSGAYPIPQPVKLDLEKAKEYLKAAGMPDASSTTFSFNVGQASTAEPMAALVKESLAKIGIKVDIQKLPDAQMSTQINGAASVLHRGHRRLAAVDRLFLSQLLHRQSALELLVDQQSGTGGDRAEGPLRARCGQV